MIYVRHVFWSGYKCVRARHYPVTFIAFLRTVHVHAHHAGCRFQLFQLFQPLFGLFELFSLIQIFQYSKSNYSNYPNYSNTGYVATPIIFLAVARCLLDERATLPVRYKLTRAYLLPRFIVLHTILWSHGSRITTVQSRSRTWTRGRA